MSNTYVCETCGKEFSRRKPFSSDCKILCHGCKISESVRLKTLENPNYQKDKLDKRKAICFKRFNCDNASKNEVQRKKISDNLKSVYLSNKEEIIEKRKATNRHEFGFDWPAQNKEIMLKGLEVQRSRNNGFVGWEDPEKQRLAELLAQIEECKQLRKDTYMHRTGYDHPKHNPEVDNSKKNYFYNGVYFDSSWELAYYIWLNDNSIEFMYHPPFYMEYLGEDGKLHDYQPDFLINGVFYEIKGNQFFNEKNEPYNHYSKSFWWCKYNAIISYGVIIYRESYMRQYLKYIKNTYGKNYLKSYRVRKGK